MMDVNERTSVRPYGKEVRVFSSPNCYLKQSVFSVSSSSFSSKTPAFSAKPRKHSQEPNAISNLRKQSLKEENLEC